LVLARVWSTVWRVMKKLFFLLIVVALGVVVAKKLSDES
jgi:hypothetical protein